ncbi:hypothetical protein E6P09_12665 [Haloferax mediterranei ATCC 33500]|uniref:Uncharacterized protein n=1 Tax=Haloferax mediterranei (strain ATCC 33500 / DSM 1411 / JCM 8866 / NBRC 14739 / NCIMB 2177 / R-4) TaxID=523841 RepID=A0A4P8P935_HALMT|nr:hypothetical protein E6P09_12665 [Haloferax mediterranei ATCC 33500]
MDLKPPSFDADYHERPRRTVARALFEMARPTQVLLMALVYTRSQPNHLGHGLVDSALRRQSKVGTVEGCILSNRYSL